MESLSVIVTTHNCAGVVLSTLQSAADALAFLRREAGDTTPAAEVVVVDDGSADRTPLVVAEFASGRPDWKLVQREQSSSPSGARNVGVREARGDLLFFLDGDDLFLPEHLAACRLALLDDPAADFVKTGVRLADPVHADWRPRIEYSIINLAVRRRCHDALGGFPDYHLFRRAGDGFEHHSDLFFKFEDMYYNQLLARLFRGASVPRETVEYCRHPGNSYDKQYAKFSRPFDGSSSSDSADRLRLRLCEALAQDLAERLLHERGPDATAADALRQARRRRAAGDVAGAALACQALLRATPEQTEAWVLLAECQQTLGKPTEAEAAYREAARLRPADAEVQLALGGLLAGRGRRQEAEACYRHAVEARPDHAEAWMQLGMAAAKEGRTDEAVARLKTACRHAPGLAKAHHNLGVALAQAGKPDEAEAAFHAALALRPGYTAAHYGLGNALAARGRHEEAVACFREALVLRPDFAEAHNNLGLSLLEVGEAEAAVVVLRQGARLRPRAAEAHNNLGLALADLGRFVEAEACYEQALRLNPNHAEAHNNLAGAYLGQGKSGEALAGYEAALRLEPESASARWNRSLALLQAGDWERGWQEYEWRWRRQGSRPRPVPRPAWDGSPLAGRTLLIWAEQGWGDMLQFLRYAPLAARTGGRVLVECPAALVPLFATCPGIARVVPEGGPLPACDCHAPLLSLPHLFKTTLATVPAEVPYLAAAPERVAAWSQRLAGIEGFKVGVAWQGNPRHRGDRHRSVALARLAPLARVPGVQLISLQRGPGSEQVGAAGTCPVTMLEGALDEEGGAFVDTTAVMRHLDLVVAVDTAVAHLAGALGVPVWLALSALPDWRWLRGREDTPWYPTMRLFRQRTLGNWDEVFERMAGALSRLAAGTHSA